MVKDARAGPRRRLTIGEGDIKGLGFGPSELIASLVSVKIRSGRHDFSPNIIQIPSWLRQWLRYLCLPRRRTLILPAQRFAHVAALGARFSRSKRFPSVFTHVSYRRVSPNQWADRLIKGGA